MRFCTIALGSAALLAGTFLSHRCLHAQPATADAATVSPIQPVPEAPVPQVGNDRQTDPQSQTGTPAPTPGPSQSSSSQTTTTQPSTSQSGSASQQPGAQQTQKETAADQLKQQETQRVAGVMATFNTTRNRDALPLSSKQKFQLFFKSAFDPWPFGLSAVVAGIGQADDSTPEWGQGMQGYGKRIGAGYADYFMGNFFGNAVLPSMLHEDPRYFQKGSGRVINRFLWAASSTVWCKRDKGGWGPNYANVGGNLIGAAIGRVYYPAADRTVSDTISDGLTVSAEGIFGAEVIEFWPDLARHHQRKQAEKQARALDAAKAQQQAKPEDPTQK